MCGVRVHVVIYICVCDDNRSGGFAIDVPVPLDIANTTLMLKSLKTRNWIDYQVCVMCDVCVCVCVCMYVCVHMCVHI